MEIRVNGISIYYEVAGEGRPVILLHGNGEDHTIFDRLTEDLAGKYKVFSPDTRGHGKSGKPDSFHYADMVEDIASFIKELGIERPVVYGFSDGGIVGLMLAAKYPHMLSGLIASGANLAPKDIKGTFRLLIRLAYVFKRDPLLKLMLDEPDITDDDLAAIKIPVLVTVAGKDVVPVGHGKHISEKIPGGSLLVITGENHGSYVIRSSKLFPLISDFLERTAGCADPAPQS
ncbi:MAG: alpha/beta hydrolase [Candidatus Methanoplasma sp.]|jgi:pimeloyl-ACP methyl ester carboxylesterase|nr:alpha/beta hydrolase [Candidatus Methanoplasma sp.]